MTRSSTTTHRHRATALVVIPLGFVVMTLNWFDIAPAFPSIGTEFSVGIPSLAFLISAFVIGYGVMHVPAGFLAARIGLRTTLVLGLVLQGLTAAGSGLAGDYTVLLVLRVLSGLGASIYAGVGIAAVSVWFVGRAHALALGVVSAAFSVGVALALFGWEHLVGSFGWRTALVVGGVAALGVAGLIAATYRVPDGEDFRGRPLDRRHVRVVLGSRRLWAYGAVFFGGYGSYFAASQLIGSYAVDVRGMGPAVASSASLLIGLAGVPGSIVCGWLSDRLHRRRAVVVVSLLTLAGGLALVPVASDRWFWLPAFVIGFAFNGCFAVWQTVPGDDPTIRPEHIGTAVGLLLTLAALGGFAVPWVFGLLSAGSGPTPAWIFLAVVTAAFSGVAVLVRDRPRSTAEPVAAAAVVRDLA